jgi:hypothetical protein
VLSLPYADQFGLWLNIPRIRLAESITIGRGVELANSSEALEDAWFDAAATIPEEAPAIRRETNARRLEQRTKGRLGWMGA